MVRVESVCRCRELCRSADWMDVMLLLLDDSDAGAGCPDVAALPIDDADDDDDESGETTTTTLVEASSSDSEVGYSLAASGGGCDC